MDQVADVVIESNVNEVKEALQEKIEAGLIAVGLTAEGNAKQLCPVDTGRLRNSITNQVLVDEKAVIIGTNVEYAPYVELGTSRMKAQPYLRPAVTNYTHVYQILLNDALKE